MTDRAPRSDSLYVRGPVPEKRAAQQVLTAEGLQMRRFLVGCLRALLADPRGFLARLDGYLPEERKAGRPRRQRD